MADDPTVEKMRERTPRIKDQALGAESVSDELHSHWARDKASRIRELQNQGYKIAKPDDIREDHDGFHDRTNAVIRKGADLVLMVGPREAMEQRELARRQGQMDMDKRAAQYIDNQGNITTDSEQHQQTKAGRKIFIP